MPAFRAEALLGSHVIFVEQTEIFHIVLFVVRIIDAAIQDGLVATGVKPVIFRHPGLVADFYRFIHIILAV